MFKSCSPIALFVVVTVLAASHAAEPDSRSFRLGFTGFPHDITLPAVVESRKFCRENSDILAHHIEGVAWTECLKDEPLPQKRTDDWKGKKEALPKGGKVYLAISPGRGDLKVLDDCQPVAAELKGKPYDDPLVIETYLKYCRRAIEFFKPDYLTIGIEVNDIYVDHGEKTWNAYVSLHKQVYEALKKEHPDLPIFASFTLHNLLNAQGDKRNNVVDAISNVLPFCDFIAISYYPFIQGGTTETAKALQWVKTTFGKHKKPYAIVETGEAAQETVFPKSGQRIMGTPQKQLDYAKELLKFAAENDCKFVIWFVHRDYDPLWEKIKDFSPEIFIAWRDTGLVDEEGTERPACELWKKSLALPLKQGR